MYLYMHVHDNSMLSVIWMAGTRALTHSLLSVLIAAELYLSTTDPSIHIYMYMYSTDYKQLSIYLCMLAKSSQVRVGYSRVHIHCLRAEVLYSLVHMCELRVARARTLRAEVLYAYVWALHTHAHLLTLARALVWYSHSCTHALVRYSHARTRPLLVSAALTSRKHSLHPRELSASEC